MKTILFSFICCLIHVCLNAQAGTLDSSFGVNGKVLNEPGPGNSFNIYHAVLQPDDKIIQVGYFEPVNSNFGLLRYMPNGAVDSSFGKDGKAIIKITLDYAEAFSAVIQPDGKIVVAGYGIKGFFSEHPIYYGVLARFNSDGSVDSSFGTNGQIHNGYSNDVSFYTVLLQPDGKIVAAGTSGSFYALVSRYLADGNPDLSFGVNGNSDIQGSIFCSGLQSDGKIVECGWTTNDINPHFLLLRFLQNGNLDISFGLGGETITSYYQSGEQIFDIAIAPDDKIVAAGTNNDGKQVDFATSRYTVNGDLDSSFSFDGKTTVIFKDSSSFCNSVALQQDGKILLAGGVAFNNNSESDYALIRLKADGLIDTSFNNNGKVTTDLGFEDEAYSVLLQSKNKIVLAGTSYDYVTPLYNASLARYNNDSTKRQIVINKIKHYISTHNNADAATLYNNFTLYPNPAKNILTINGLDAKTNYELLIMNDKGNVVVSKQVNNVASYQFNVQNLSSGVYYVNVAASNKIITTLKFVKE